MVMNRKPTGRAKSIPGGLAVGGMFSLLITILGSAIIAKLVDSEIMAENSIGYGIMAILLAASWFGAMVSFGQVRRRRVMICLLSGGIYMLILLGITALFFGGQYSGVGETGLMVLCGSALAILPEFRRESRAGKKKIRIPTR